MPNAISAAALVNVIPGVLAAGGNPLSLNGLFLTESGSVPIGAVYQFASLEGVQNFFGADSREAEMAAIYFNGFDGSQTKPSVIYFAQYNDADVAAYLRSGSFEGVTLAELQLLSGLLTITIDGVAETTANIDLSGATSFSNAASLIQTALDAQAAGTTCVYDSQLNAFVITSPTTGAASTISFASNTLSAGLKLTEALGAVTSQGADAAVPATLMSQLVTVTRNWFSLVTVFEPDTATKLLFAEWVQTQGKRYGYVGWDSTTNITQGAQPTSFGAQVVAADMDGIFPLFDLSEGDKAAFVAGAAGSIDFGQTQGRIDFAYKHQAGLVADVTDETAALNLESNGYNYYANYATANDQFTNLQRGSTPGAWQWWDTYVNQAWLNASLQLAYMVYFQNARSTPYNDEGYSTLRSVALDPINAALNAGVIQRGVTLSNSQRAQINTAVGSLQAAQAVEQNGWYLDIKPAAPATRALRGSPPMTLYYTDGGSVQRIVLNSIAVQ